MMPLHVSRLRAQIGPSHARPRGMSRSNTCRYAQSTLPAPMIPTPTPDPRSSAFANDVSIRRRVSCNHEGTSLASAPGRYGYWYLSASRVCQRARSTLSTATDRGKQHEEAGSTCRPFPASVPPSSRADGGHGGRDAFHPRRVRQRRTCRTGRIAHRPDRLRSRRLSQRSAGQRHARLLLVGGLRLPRQGHQDLAQGQRRHAQLQLHREPRRHPGEAEGQQQLRGLRPDHVLPGVQAALHGARDPRAHR